MDNSWIIIIYRVDVVWFRGLGVLLREKDEGGGGLERCLIWPSVINTIRTQTSSVIEFNFSQERKTLLDVIEQLADLAYIAQQRRYLIIEFSRRRQAWD